VPKQFFYCASAPQPKINEPVTDNGKHEVAKETRVTEDNEEKVTYKKKTAKIPLLEHFHIPEIGNDVEFSFSNPYFSVTHSNVLTLNYEMNPKMVKSIWTAYIWKDSTIWKDGKICKPNKNINIDNIKNPPTGGYFNLFPKYDVRLKGNHDVVSFGFSVSGSMKNMVILKIDDKCIAIRARLSGEQVVYQWKPLGKQEKPDLAKTAQNQGGQEKGAEKAPAKSGTE